MKFYHCALVLSLAFSLSFGNAAAESAPSLKFDEVFNLVRTNLLHLNDEELSRMAAEGLLKELGALAQLGSEEQETNQLAAEAISRQAIYADSYGYVRVNQVTASLPRELKAAYEALASTNRIKGLVIDLRFSGGRDYRAAVGAADLFLGQEQVLLKLGGKELRSTSKTARLKVPVAILVNEQTRGASEALAAILREEELGLVIGSRTAGEALLYQEFTLSTGQKLRLGSIPVSLPDGQALSGEGLRPDIAVAVDAAAEEAYYADPFLDLSRVFGDPNATNLVAISTNRTRPLNEAELVRRHREGISIDPSAELFEDQEPVAVVTDPVLARGLDFLKGVSVLQQFRPL